MYVLGFLSNTRSAQMFDPWIDKNENKAQTPLMEPCDSKARLP